MKKDVNKEIEQLREVPEDLFKGIKDRKKRKEIMNKMQDELAFAFGGDTSDGGYITDGELWEKNVVVQVVWLRKLHDKYKKIIKELA